MSEETYKMVRDRGVEKPPASLVRSSPARALLRARPSPARSVNIPPRPLQEPPSFARWARSTIRDPHWAPRGVLIALLGWFLVRYLLDPRYTPPFAAVNLVVHEAGHALFYWSGSQWWMVAGGTLFELAVPPLVAILFARQRDALGVLVATFWLGTALVDVSIYVRDARAQLLPLVSMWAGTPIHDWNYLLGRAGWLPLDQSFGRLLRLLGLLAMGVAVGGGAWLVGQYRRWAAGDRPGNDEGQPIP